MLSLLVQFPSCYKLAEKRSGLPVHFEETKSCTFWQSKELIRTVGWELPSAILHSERPKLHRVTLWSFGHSECNRVKTTIIWSLEKKDNSLLPLSLIISLCISSVICAQYFIFLHLFRFNCLNPHTPTH